MKAPILGKQDFLTHNNEIYTSFEKFVTEVYEKKEENRPMYTGRYFAVLKDKSQGFNEVNRLFESNAGLKIASSQDFATSSINESELTGVDALIYEDLGVALFSGDDDQVKMMTDAAADYMVQPEKVVYVPDDAPAILNIPSTWGVHITKAANSKFTGKGVKVAVLDTGFDSNHPDFNGRNVAIQSFVPNEAANDVHGHGTHCIGTACGDTDMHGIRYGVATGSDIFSGKVLSNSGSGAQAWILNGITWALNNGCKVISMSLGSPVFPGMGYDSVYESAAQFALSKGSIIVAAAGNDSDRSRHQYRPVGSPANCPSIIAVAAIDQYLNVANFSNRTINPTGDVDIAGPGVDVYSSWPMRQRYRTISGTSMATPHVAGILAMLWERSPNASPQQIRTELTNLARSLSLPSMDVGAGLSTAP